MDLSLIERALLASLLAEYPVIVGSATGIKSRTVMHPASADFFYHFRDLTLKEASLDRLHMQAPLENHIDHRLFPFVGTVTVILLKTNQ